MRHFDVTQWTDFARRAIGEAERAEMAAHLESGCATCRRTVDFLGQVVELAAAEASLEPPGHSVRTAKALLALNRPERARRLRPLAFRLGYDSARDLALANLRTARGASRQLVYYAEDYALSLRLDREPGSGRVQLGGEILDRRSEPVSRVPAVLLSPTGVVAHAVSDQLGEFRVQYPSGEAVRLCLLVSDSECLDVPLDPVEGPAEPPSAAPGEPEGGTQPQ